MRMSPRQCERTPCSGEQCGDSSWNEGHRESTPPRYVLQFTLKPAQMCVAALVLWAGSWRWQDSCPVPTSTCPHGHMAGSPGHAGAALPWPWALVPVHTPQAPAFVLTPPQKSIPPRPFLSHLLRSHCCPPCTGLGVPGSPSSPGLDTRPLALWSMPREQNNAGHSPGAGSRPNK